jgi:hypothetical protein
MLFALRDTKENVQQVSSAVRSVAYIRGDIRLEYPTVIIVKFRDFSRFPKHQSGTPPLVNKTRPHAILA